MMRNIDLSSWSSIFSTLLGIAVFALIGISIRLLVMMTFQQRRERMNRQINERLKTLIAAYKVLGGSFTGNLAVDPTHLRDIRRRAAEADQALAEGEAPSEGSDRARRIRDAVETALSDIILLGTEDHVRLAGRAARELVEGKPVYVGELVESLRNFIRAALDLDPIPADAQIPRQGPARPSSGGGRSGGGKGEGGGGRSGGGGMGGGGMGGGGMGMGMGMGLRHLDDTDPPATG